MHWIIGECWQLLFQPAIMAKLPGSFSTVVLVLLLLMSGDSQLRHAFTELSSIEYSKSFCTYIKVSR